jgi:hypothetical protein
MKLTPTEEQVVDIFTKGVSAKKIEKMCVQLRVLSRSMIKKDSVLRGSVEGATPK